MICPKCNFERKEDFDFCSNCGTKQINTCNCGSTIMLSENFCSKCGAKNEFASNVAEVSMYQRPQIQSQQVRLKKKKDNYASYRNYSSNKITNIVMTSVFLGMLTMLFIALFTPIYRIATLDFPSEFNDASDIVPNIITINGFIFRYIFDAIYALRNGDYGAAALFMLIRGILYIFVLLSVSVLTTVGIIFGVKSFFNPNNKIERFVALNAALIMLVYILSRQSLLEFNIFVLSSSYRDSIGQPIIISGVYILIALIISILSLVACKILEIILNAKSSDAKKITAYVLNAVVLIFATITLFILFQPMLTLTISITSEFTDSWGDIQRSLVMVDLRGGIFQLLSYLTRYLNDADAILLPNEVYQAFNSAATMVTIFAVLFIIFALYIVSAFIRILLALTKKSHTKKINLIPATAEMLGVTIVFMVLVNTLLSRNIITEYFEFGSWREIFSYCLNVSNTTFIISIVFATLSLAAAITSYCLVNDAGNDRSNNGHVNMQMHNQPEFNDNVNSTNESIEYFEGKTLPLSQNNFSASNIQSKETVVNLIVNPILLGVIIMAIIATFTPIMSSYDGGEIFMLREFFEILPIIGENGLTYNSLIPFIKSIVFLVVVAIIYVVSITGGIIGGIKMSTSRKPLQKAVAFNTAMLTVAFVVVSQNFLRITMLEEIQENVHFSSTFMLVTIFISISILILLRILDFFINMKEMSVKKSAAYFLNFTVIILGITTLIILTQFTLSASNEVMTITGGIQAIRNILNPWLNTTLNDFNIFIISTMVFKLCFVVLLLCMILSIIKHTTNKTINLIVIKSNMLFYTVVFLIISRVYINRINQDLENIEGNNLVLISAIIILSISLAISIIAVIMGKNPKEIITEDSEQTEFSWS